MSLDLELLLAGLRLTISAGMPGDGGDDVCEGVDGNGDGDFRFCALSRQLCDHCVGVSSKLEYPHRLRSGKTTVRRAAEISL